ncbi:hypothetical protein V6U71_01375 [Sphingopyxis sp. J-6]|uniref:hypothetical protein n=1 Tax=Sphingopyxis sp. J-6 TaxID=3122054 RepID=UPI003983E368
MVAILFLLLPLPFLLLGYFGKWKVTAAIIGLLGLWLVYILYLHRTGDPNDPSLNEYGAQIFPYFLGVLIAGMSLAHGIGWSVRYLKTRFDDNRARSKLGETFE